MSDVKYPFVVNRGGYTVLAIANMADGDQFAVEFGIPNDPTMCDPTKMLWTPAKRCGVGGIVDGSANPMVFDIPGNYRLVWNTTPNPDVVVWVNEDSVGGSKIVNPQAV